MLFTQPGTGGELISCAVGHLWHPVRLWVPPALGQELCRSSQRAQPGTGLALSLLALLWPHSQLSAPPHPTPAALPAPPPAQLAEQGFQFIISSLLPVFSAACSAGLYLRSSMDNLQLLIQHIYLFSHCMADLTFPSSSEFLHSSHCPTEPWQSQGVDSARVFLLSLGWVCTPALPVHIGRAHVEVLF